MEEPAAEAAAVDENAESQSISADDIAAILNSIPVEKPAGGQEPKNEIAEVLESVELEEVIEPATPVVAEVSAAAIAMVTPSPSWSRPTRLRRKLISKEWIGFLLPTTKQILPGVHLA